MMRPWLPERSRSRANTSPCGPRLAIARAFRGEADVRRLGEVVLDALEILLLDLRRAEHGKADRHVLGISRAALSGHGDLLERVPRRLDREHRCRVAPEEQCGRAACKQLHALPQTRVESMSHRCLPLSNQWTP